MSTLHEPRERREEIPPYRLPPGVKPRRYPAEAVADEVDFFGWYYGIAPDETIPGWPAEHRNWMAARLGMNRDSLDRALYRARHRQEQDDDPPFYRLQPAAGDHRQRVQQPARGL